MKLLTIALVSTLSLASLSASAATYKFVTTDKSISSQVCVAAGNNNVLQFKNVIKDLRLTNNFVFNKVECNGQNIGDFAAKYNAFDTAALINKHRKQSVSISDIAMRKAKNRVNGDEVIVITVN